MTVPPRTRCDIACGEAPIGVRSGYGIERDESGGQIND